MNSLVKAVNILKSMDPAQRALAIQLTKPDPVARRKKPGPKPGTKRKPPVAPVEQARAPKGRKQRIAAEPPAGDPDPEAETE